MFGATARLCQVGCILSRGDLMVVSECRYVRLWAAWLVIFISLLVQTACSGSDDQTGEMYTQWDLAGGCASGLPGSIRRDAENRDADFCDTVDGAWTWVVYSAAWCSASRNQAYAVRRFFDMSQGRVQVFAVVTSGDDPFVLPTVYDARDWSSLLGLPTSRVLFETESAPRTIPQHLLLGPDGRTMYRYIGSLEAEDMMRIVGEFASGQRRPNY